MTSEIKITRFVVGKGKTIKPSEAEEWFKNYYEIEAEVPQTYTRESIEEIRLQIEAMITDWLSKGEHESKEKSTVPDFDSEDLMKHAWKGKRIGQGQYTEGSLSWGWDFRDEFKPETIKALEQDAVFVIDKYQFTLMEKIVQTQKIKDG